MKEFYYAMHDFRLMGSSISLNCLPPSWTISGIFLLIGQILTTQANLFGKFLDHSHFWALSHLISSFICFSPPLFHSLKHKIFLSKFSGGSVLQNLIYLCKISENRILLNYHLMFVSFDQMLSTWSNPSTNFGLMPRDVSGLN